VDWICYQRPHVISLAAHGQPFPGGCQDAWHWPQFFIADSYIGEAFPCKERSAVFGGEVLTTRGELVLYRSIWIAAQASAIVLVWHPRTLNGDRQCQESERPIYGSTLCRIRY
jgi:hypothetical protein